MRLVCGESRNPEAKISIRVEQILMGHKEESFLPRLLFKYVLSPNLAVIIIRAQLILIGAQGEESITSVELSQDGTILAVATMTNLKFFQLRSKHDSLKVRKIPVPLELTKSGAKSIIISLDQRWLSVIRSDNSIQLYRIMKSATSKTPLQFLSTVVHLKRLRRDPTKLKGLHGTLGNYDRSITHQAFSADSRILAVGDLAGFLDTWVLEGYEDLTQVPDRKATDALMLVDSDDEDSDQDSDEEQHATVILGQHWIRNPSAKLLIKLPAAPLVLSFRPSSTQSKLALTNGVPGLHPTRHTPHPHSHNLPDGEDRLFALTSENQMYEFNVLSGRLSDWSRRNPTSSLPQDFRNVRDRAVGVIWDVQGKDERIWLYGVSWLWMFDLSRDLQASKDQDGNTAAINGEHKTKQLKRKRPQDSDDDNLTARTGNDTGAGSKIAKSELGVGIGPKIRRIKGIEAEKGELIAIQAEQSPSSDDEGLDTILANEDSPALISLRGDIRDGGESQRDSDANESDMEGGNTATEERRTAKRTSSKRPSHWHTFKYRPILGIVPIGGETDDEAASEGENDSDDDSPTGVEVVLVERPLWDVDLPPRYYGNQEWNP